MSGSPDITTLPAAPLAPGEAEFAREAIALLDRTLLLTVDADMAVVRIFGSDKTDSAVRVGLSPQRAMRLGAAFIRAALRLDPSLRAQVIEGGNVTELQALIGEGAAP